MKIADPAPNPAPNPASNVETSLYNMIGGESKVRALVDRFYDLMDQSPDYYGIRKLHPESLHGSREKLFMFLSGWLGGPQLYTEAFGHPRLRARHLPFAIGTSERDQWMGCMTEAMVDVDIETSMRERLVASFANTADWMRNKEP